MTWLKRQLKRGTVRNEDMICNCGIHNKNGKGLYCFKHQKQTPNKEVRK